MADEDDNTPTSDSADPPTTAPLGSVKGRAKLFTLLSCGFIACLCCVTGTFAGIGLGWMRMSHLAGTVNAVGMPVGWTLDDSSALPWAAHADLSGPVDAAAVSTWLTGLGEATDESGAAECLTDSCEVTFAMDDEEVVVVVSGDSDKGLATVTVG